MSYSVLQILLLTIELPRLDKRELMFLLSITRNFVVSNRRGFFFFNQTVTVTVTVRVDSKKKDDVIFTARWGEL